MLQAADKVFHSFGGITAAQTLSFWVIRVMDLPIVVLAIALLDIKAPVLCRFEYIVPTVSLDVGIYNGHHLAACVPNDRALMLFWRSPLAITC
jgi:hypothetical protein